MKKSIPKFCALTLLAIIPIFLYIGLYIYLDPFRVVQRHEPFFCENKPMYVGWNKGYVSVENFKQQYKKQNYDSFIFGTSRSINFLTTHWQPYLNSDASIYHFDASAESLNGILYKIDYIKSCDVKINNALIILDVDMLPRVDSRTEHLYAQHPDITPEFDTFAFHKKFFEVFNNKDFIKAYIDYIFNGIQKYMTDDYIFTSHTPTYNPVTNEESYPQLDSLINAAPQLYYNAERVSGFPKKEHESIAEQVLKNGSESLSILTKISKSLTGTEITIILPPNLNLIKIHPEDAKIIGQLFGSRNIFDFSGDISIARDYHSFYDNTSHARPEICKILIDSIYSNQ